MSIRGNPIGWPLHDHDDIYQPKGSYSTSSHDHDDIYQPKGSYATSSHDHDTRYLHRYELNSINIDNTEGLWTVDISEQGHGAIPEWKYSNWVNVTQFTGGHCCVQIGINAEKSDDVTRYTNRMWIRNKYVNGKWSAWMPVTGLGCSACGSSASLTLPSNAITKINLDCFRSGTNYHDFVFVDGGVRVPWSGMVMVSGSVYIKGSTTDTTMMEGAYVYKNDTEVAGAWLYQHATSSIATPVALVEVDAGDVIYLKARRYGAGDCLPSAGGTHLDIMYV